MVRSIGTLSSALCALLFCAGCWRSGFENFGADACCALADAGLEDRRILDQVRRDAWSTDRAAGDAWSADRTAGADARPIDTGVAHDSGTTAPLVTRIDIGNNHTCALAANGRVKCWGSNALGQLGLGDTFNRGDGANEMGQALPEVALGVDTVVGTIAVGDDHACVLDRGWVKCWGDNHNGQLGLGDVANRGDQPNEMGAALPAVALTGTSNVLVVGSDHSCELDLGGAVRCWGDNNYGQLGLGDLANRGDNAGEMGAQLPALDLGAAVTSELIAAGCDHTCALTAAGLKCWGSNLYGQLGLGDTNNRGDAPGEMGVTLPAVSLAGGLTVDAFALGCAHTCAIVHDAYSRASLRCWGHNQDGQLGLGDTLDRGDQAGEVGVTLPAVALGANRYPVALAAGGDSTCAVLDNGQVKCWGSNAYGRLGLGDTQLRGDQPGTMGDTLPATDLATSAGTGTIQIAASGHLCALLVPGVVKCWGYNAFGQLGLGDSSDRGDSAGEMGVALPAVPLW